MDSDWIRIGDNLYNLRHVTDVEFRSDEDDNPIAIITLAMDHGGAPRQVVVTGSYVDGLRQFGKRLVPNDINEEPGYTM